MKVTKRVGIVVQLKPDMRALYLLLHADEHSGVRDLLQKYNIHNFSIFLRELDDNNEYLFGYYEYTGDDYEEDMAKLAQEPRNIEWLKITDPCQKPQEGESSWAHMTYVYYNR